MLRPRFDRFLTLQPATSISESDCTTFKGGTVRSKGRCKSASAVRPAAFHASGHEKRCTVAEISRIKKRVRAFRASMTGVLHT